MMSKRELLVILILCTLTLVPCAQAEVKWKLAPGRTSISFKVSHFLLTTVKGKFKKYSGEVVTPGINQFAGARVEAAIDVASIDTGNDDRDEHLRQPVFFNVAAFPSMKFRSVSVKKVSGDNYKMKGTISIRGVSRPISLDVVFTGDREFKNGKKCCHFKAIGSLDRTHFGLKWNELTEAGGLAVGNDVQIEIRATLLQT